MKLAHFLCWVFLIFLPACSLGKTGWEGVFSVVQPADYGTAFFEHTSRFFYLQPQKKLSDSKNTVAAEFKMTYLYTPWPTAFADAYGLSDIQGLVFYPLYESMKGFVKVALPLSEAGRRTFWFAGETGLSYEFQKASWSFQFSHLLSKNVYRYTFEGPFSRDQLSLSHAMVISADMGGLKIQPHFLFQTYYDYSKKIRHNQSLKIVLLYGLKQASVFTSYTWLRSRRVFLTHIYSFGANRGGFQWGFSYKV